jgi:strictosidine synthase-like protein
VFEAGAKRLGKWPDRLRGWLNPGEDALNVPTLDGPWRPNDLIEAARLVAELDAPDNLALTSSGLWCSAGGRLLRITDADLVVEEDCFETPISCLGDSADGGLVIGFNAGGLLWRGGARDGFQLEQVAGTALRCPTAVAAGADGEVFIADASSHHAPQDWVRDLMEKRSDGRVLALDPKDNTRVVASGIAYPQGLLATASGLLIAESWRHRLRLLGTHGNEVALSQLAGYPGRLSAAPDGGYWLALFAMRTKLVEFVLLENAYREQMMRTIEPRYWVAPMLSSSGDHLEPLQGGAVKQLGILKPWAPPRSYGLVVRLDARLQPLYSLHSRAAGKRHGITSAVQRGGTLYLTAKGGNQLLAVDLASLARPGAAL